MSGEGSGFAQAIEDIQAAINVANAASSGYAGGSPKAIIKSAAESTKEQNIAMCSNEGQLSIINTNINPNIDTNAEIAMADSPEFDWIDVETEYYDAVGEILEEANRNMHYACRTAEELQQAIDEAIEGKLIDAVSIVNPFAAFVWYLSDIASDIMESIEDTYEDRYY